MFSRSASNNQLVQKSMICLKDIHKRTLLVPELMAQARIPSGLWKQIQVSLMQTECSPRKYRIFRNHCKKKINKKKGKKVKEKNEKKEYKIGSKKKAEIDVIKLCIK